MSAALAWDVAVAPTSVPTRRPQLVSVPCGPDLRAAKPVRLRPTRAARLAMTAASVLVVVTAAVAMVSGGASATAIDHSTTVRAGETLSQIAVEQLPQLPVAEAVNRIEVANNLTSSGIHAGQTLLIPSVR